MIPTDHHFDLLVVGAGLTGATIARLAADTGFRVMALERRDAVGGNVRDAVHAPSGIRYGLYGPHYFRTSSQRIWDFVNRFAAFRPFAAEVKTIVAGHLEDWPVTEEYLERAFGERWQQLVPVYRRADLNNFEDVCLASMPRAAYEGFVRGYTAKQWGADPRGLEPGLAGRFEIRRKGPDGGCDRRLKTSTWQGVPEGGYAAMVERMLDGIEVYCGVDWRRCNAHVPPSPPIVFTGAIDEFFRFELGRLRYRAQLREHHWLSDDRLLYPTVQTNIPNPAVPSIRVIEWRHMMPEIGTGTLITEEYPYSPTDPDAYEYPFPAAADRTLYRRYRQRAAAVPNVLFAGRLGEYRYFDMDQAIARAMKWFAVKIAPVLAGRPA